MDLHYRKASTVGALVLSAVVVFVAGAIWLQGRSLTSGNLHTIVFQDIGNLKRGAAVRVSGVEVGNVERIEFRGVGDVAVYVSLSDSRVVPKADARASISSVGIIGDVELTFDPGTSSQPLPEGSEIPGSMDGGLADLGGALAGRADSLMVAMTAMFSQRLSDDIHATLVSSQRMMDVLADTASGPMYQLAKTLEAMRGLSERLDSTLADDHFQGTLANMDSATAGLTELTRQLTLATARMDTMLFNINSGRGTLGKLATDTALYQGLLETQASIKALVDTLTATPGKLNLKVELF